MGEIAHPLMYYRVKLNLSNNLALCIEVVNLTIHSLNACQEEALAVYEVKVKLTISTECIEHRGVACSYWLAGCRIYEAAKRNAILCDDKNRSCRNSDCGLTISRNYCGTIGCNSTNTCELSTSNRTCGSDHQNRCAISRCRFSCAYWNRLATYGNSCLRVGYCCTINS